MADKFDHIVIFHDDMDGQCSARIVREKFPSAKIKFCPINYRDPFDFSIINKETELWVLDFSFPQEDMYMISSLSKKLHWVDHHKSALSISEQSLINAECVVDIFQSSSLSVWKLLFPDKPIPDVVKFVDDYDLWQFRYKETKRFHEWAVLRLNDPDDALWGELFNKGIDPLYLHIGEILNMKKTKAIKEFVDRGYFGTINGVKAYYVNSPIYASEIGEYVYLRSEEPIVVVIYQHVGPNRVVFSLRSNSVNVRKIAEKFGGGGHDFASGFELNNPMRKMNRSLQNIIDGRNWKEVFGDDDYDLSGMQK